MLSKSQRDHLRHYANMAKNEPDVHMRSCFIERLKKAGPTAIPSLLDAADELERLRETFRHYHIAGDEDDDSCARCGLDLRNPIHGRLNDGGDDGSK